MKKSIAIIGMAGRFPQATDLLAIHELLRSGGDAVNRISKDRICHSTLPLLATDFRPMGWLADVDKFDYKYFNISGREAEQIDPHQRIMLECAVECIEHAGYSTEAVSGSRMLILGANADYQYYKHFDHFEPAMFPGNTPFSVAGRISRYLNTKAPAWVVDTGCSSALFQVSQACEYLNAGLAETALVIAARVMLDPIREGLTYDVGVTSDDSKTRTFNADSKGSGSSEAVVSILLKPLEQAQADGDNILAVVRAAASNSSGNSASSLTATSSVAQTEVLLEAWRQADINPRSIGYIEPHGSATRLGDPIEVAAIDKAMRSATQDKHFCALSCVKTNIGHTDKVAGLAGLLKAVLSLQHRELYASLHFETPNPFIDFANSSTFVNTELRPWEKSDGMPLHAGVSSWGFAGNNVHVLLEEAAPRAGDERPREQAYPVCISSKRSDGVTANINKLREHLDYYSDADLADIAYTLNVGRSHYRYRCILVARTTAELREMLAHVPAQEVSFDSGADPSRGILFVCSDDSGWSSEDIAVQAAADADFAAAYAECRAVAQEDDMQNPACLTVIGQFCAWTSLHKRGIRSSRILGLGIGDVSVQLIMGEIRPEHALDQARIHVSAGPPEDMQMRVQALVERESTGGRVLFIEMGPGGELSAALDDWQPAERDLMFEVLRFDPRQFTAAAVLAAELYACHFAVDWSAWHAQRAGRRINLPAYQFEALRAWARPAWTDEQFEEWQRSIKDPNAPAPALNGHSGESKHSTTHSAEQDFFKAPDLGPAIEAAAVDESWTLMQQRIARIWQAVLKTDSIQLDDDFFGLGGHSLFGTMVTSRIEQEFQVRLQFKDVLNFSTVRRMAAGVEQLLEAGANTGLSSLDIRPAPSQEVYDLSYSQRPMWIINQVDGGQNLAYNLVSALHLQGEFDLERFEHAFRKMIDRHEIFRSSFEMHQGKPVQKIHPSVEFSIEHRSARAGGVDEAIHAFTRPFDLQHAPIIRAALLSVEGGGRMLLVDVHHIIFDGTSAAIFLAEFAALYRGEQLAPVPLHYKDFAHRQKELLNSASGAKQAAWWQAQFATPPPALELPTDFPRPPERSYAGSRLNIALETSVVRGVRTAAREREVTLFMYLLAAYYALLQRYSGQKDIVVGTPVAGRTHVALENIPGMFVNTLALRAQLESTMRFDELLAQVKTVCLDSLAHQEYPIERLVDDLKLVRDASRSPLFDVMLLLQNVASTQVQIDDKLSMRHHEFAPRSSKFDLSFEFVEDSHDLVLGVEYSSDLFERSSIETMVQDYLTILKTSVTNAQIRIADIPIGIDYKKIASDSTSGSGDVFGTDFGEF